MMIKWKSRSIILLIAYRWDPTMLVTLMIQWKQMLLQLIKEDLIRNDLAFFHGWLV